MDREILDHYAAGVELGRLERGASRIELARTQELLERYLPPPPATVLDVGGGPGVYADWLARMGYGVRLVDAVPLHVEAAEGRAAGMFEVATGDARRLDEADDTYDVVLLLGPLYHLTEHEDRVRALAEARRVARSSGLVAAAAISRFASLLDGLSRGRFPDRDFLEIVERDLATGHHRNPDGRPEWFTTAFFHHPDELAGEVADAGLELDALYGVEGPAWLFPELWDEPGGRDVVLRAARAVEREPTLLGLSAHLLAVAHRR